MQRYVRIGGAIFGAAALIGIAACSGRSSTGEGGLPAVGQAPFQTVPVPGTSPTPPVTAPVTIPYPYTNKWVTKTWAGPTAKPVSTKGKDAGVITVKFALKKKTGIYDVLETIKSKYGPVENLDSAIGFLAHGGGIAQIILSDDYTYVDGPFSETGMDTYPKGQNSFDFPLTTGNHWSAAALHTSYYNEYLSGKGSFAENGAFTEGNKGTYTSQTSFSSLGRSKIQDNYASTTQVQLGKPSVYTLSERAAGYNELTQTFELPSGGDIDVRSQGRKPLPVRRGTVKVPDWYPGSGALPSTFYSDLFDVIGTAKMPPACGSRAGASSTEVEEKFENLDPVQGFYDTYDAFYYLARLAKGQYWFACIVEKYTDETYANGWAMSAGDWGKLSYQQVGTEILIASGAKSQNLALPPNMATLPALTFSSLGFRMHVER
jgi:hypothetical protein